MSVEEKLAKGFGYEHCILFPYARVAIAWWKHIWAPDAPIFIPSNVCQALALALDTWQFIPVAADSGLAPQVGPILVQLYGTRANALPGTMLEIDPMLTGWGMEPQAEVLIVSFGYGKTIDIGMGGALLTNNRFIAEDMRGLCRFPDDLRPKLEHEIDNLPYNIARRRALLAYWDNYLSRDVTFKKPAFEPVIPWRVIRLACGDWKRDVFVEEYRRRGLRVGTNYPPLPGVTDPSAKAWGDSVINFFLEDNPA